MDATLEALKGHWLIRETIGYLRRTFSRLDVTSRSLFALIEEGSCFAGSLFELALACDRIYHLSLPGEAARSPKIASARRISAIYPMATGQSRLGRRFYDEKPALEAVAATMGEPLDANAALALGLATSSPDDIDWADETRLAIEERVSMSPDALSAMEANLRFNGHGDHLHAHVSAASLPGKTGSSSGRTRSARRARSKSMARARRPPSTGIGFSRFGEKAHGTMSTVRGHQAASDRSRRSASAATPARPPARSERSPMTRATTSSTPRSAISAWRAFLHVRQAASITGAPCRAPWPTASMRS